MSAESRLPRNLAHLLWPGDAGVASQDEAQRPVDCMTDADADCYPSFLRPKAIIADLQWRIGIRQVKPIVLQPGEPKRLTEPAGSGGQLTGLCAGIQAPVPCHPVCSTQRFQCAEQNAAGPAFNLARDVSAKIPAINRINICMPGWTEENGIARRGSAMGVSCRIRRIVVRAEVSFDFDDPARQNSTPGRMHKHLAQQARSHQLRLRLEKGAGKPGAQSFQCLWRESWDANPAYLCDFFHSLMRASTCSAWPSGVTLGKMCSSV